VKRAKYWSIPNNKDLTVKVLEGIHYIEHPLADIWTGVVIAEGDPLIVVDSATHASACETILPYLAGNRLYTPGQPVLVVNTHCHCDHIGGNAALKAELGAAVAAHEADVAFIESRRAQFDALFGPFSAYPDLAMDRQTFLAQAGEDTRVDQPLTHGQRFSLGHFEFEVIHTPGHTLGSLALYEASLGLLIAGDSVQGQGTTDTHVPLIVDLPAYRSSMRRLTGLDMALLIGAHPFKPHATACLGGPAASSFVCQSEAAADEYLSGVARLLSAQQGPISLLDLSTRMSRQLGLARPNRYLLILVCACVNELIELGEASRLSGPGWHPGSVFSAV
jgi:hydroxyacylglutathione hydrolase